jgi:hypothetical protein
VRAGDVEAQALAQARYSWLLCKEDLLSSFVFFGSYGEDYIPRLNAILTGKLLIGR